LMNMVQSLEAAIMARSEFDALRCEKCVAAFIERRRPPPHIRSKLDLAFRQQGQSVELFEIRPSWDGSALALECSVAKATYSKRTRVWKVYWIRADLKWHRYSPAPEVDSIEDFLAFVDEDEHGCFFG